MRGVTVPEQRAIATSMSDAPPVLARPSHRARGRRGTDGRPIGTPSVNEISVRRVIRGREAGQVPAMIAVSRMCWHGSCYAASSLTGGSGRWWSHGRRREFGVGQ
jgi:hypothetical protein